MAVQVLHLRLRVHLLQGPGAAVVLHTIVQRSMPLGALEVAALGKLLVELPQSLDLLIQVVVVVAVEKIQAMVRQAALA